MSDEKSGKWIPVKSPEELKAGCKIRYRDAGGPYTGERFDRTFDGNYVLGPNGSVAYTDIEVLFSSWDTIETWREEPFKFDSEKCDDPLEPKNGKRAAWAEKAVRAFLAATGEPVRIQEDEIGDLLCDLLHRCDREEIDAQTLVDRAIRNWRHER